MPLPTRFFPRSRLALSLPLLALLLPAASYLLVPRPLPARAAGATTAPASTEQAAADRKEQEIARVMEFFRVTQPDVYDQAKSLREVDPARFEKLVRGALGTVNHLEAIKKNDPLLFDLKMKDLALAYQSLRLARELQKPGLTPAEHGSLATQLTKVVTDEFDICQQERQQEIADLRTRLQDLDKQLQERAKDKDALIKQRVQDLVEKPPRLDW